MSLRMHVTLEEYVGSIDERLFCIAVHLDCQPCSGLLTHPGSMKAALRGLYEGLELLMHSWSGSKALTWGVPCRPVSVTLARIWAALSAWERTRFMWNLVTCRDISAEAVEQLRVCGPLSALHPVLGIWPPNPLG